MVEITRCALAEPGRAKLAIAKVAGPDAQPKLGPGLRARIDGSDHPVRLLAHHGPDLLEQAGWSEVIEEARSGLCAFDGGGLRLSLTPAMTLIDVDGWLPLADLALAGARASAAMILRHGIGCSIGIDLPTVESKAARLAAAEVVDAVLPQPFERTAVNGFGFLQIVRRRARASLPERVQGDPVGAAARALLRQTERAGGVGCRTLVAGPLVHTVLAARPDWIEQLSRRVGAPIGLREKGGLAISSGYVEVENP
jgi:hypothetical protein